MSLIKLKKELTRLKDPKKAKILQGFFKTGKGDYGEGDLFLGIQVPVQRNLVKKYSDELNLQEIKKLLFSKFHEERLIALLVLINKFEKAFKEDDTLIARNLVYFYLSNLSKVNNWDLVDLSAPNILGRSVYEKLISSKKIIQLANSDKLWARRVSIISTFYLIRKGDLNLTLKISKMIIQDKEDLIQKAIGWMLREVGKRDPKLEENFIKMNYSLMSRTTLRYAIEKFPEQKRRKYLLGQF